MSFIAGPTASFSNSVPRLFRGQNLAIQRHARLKLIPRRDFFSANGLIIVTSVISCVNTRTPSSVEKTVTAHPHFDAGFTFLRFIQQNRCPSRIETGILDLVLTESANECVKMSTAAYVVDLRNIFTRDG